MAQKFQLPPAGQIDLTAYPVNTVRERSRRALIARAKKFVDTVTVANGPMRNVAFSPEKGNGVAFLFGGARIVADTLYELYTRSPEDSVRGAIAWSINQAPDLVLDEFDLGGRRGPISQSAYQLGLAYFEASMDSALDEQKATRIAREREERRNRFRSAGNRRGTAIGKIVSAQQRKQLEDAVKA